MQTLEIKRLAKLADDRILKIREDLEVQLTDFIRVALEKEPMLSGFVSGMGMWFFYDKNGVNHSDDWSFKKYASLIETVSKVVEVLHYVPSFRLDKDENKKIINSLNW